jgi:methylthioxylose transferase
MPAIRPAALGLILAVLLMTAAMVVPVATGWDVRIGIGPLYAHWMPRVGPGTPAAIVVGALGVVYGDRVAQRLTWRTLLVTVWLVGLAWLTTLALVDGRAGLSAHNDIHDFLQVARAPVGISDLLQEFVARIPLGPHAWPTHVAGHPPGALLFFVALVGAGLGGDLAVGIVVTLLASTIPLAVLVTLRLLGDESAARLAAPFVVLTPAAIWLAVSGDAVYACVGAWGLAALAAATTTRLLLWSTLSGLLLGTAVLMSYGLPLLGLLAVAVLAAARSVRPVFPAAAAACLVVAGFWLAGFSLWDAYPAIHQRYWAGVAHSRPASYWLWGDLAALCFSAGPVLGAAVGCWATQLRVIDGAVDRAISRVVWWLGAGALAAIAVADASLMSKAEVERIWLPFVPWLLGTCALLPARWRRPALALQVVSALLVQHLLLTGW